jgi:hypothetical protein
MSDELVELAKRYSELSDELVDVRRRMLSCLTNSAGEPNRVPTRPRGHAPRGEKRSAMLAKSEEEDARVLALLRSNPLRQATIAQTVGAKTSTLQARLRRLEANGLVQRGDDGLWSSTSTQA